VERPYAIFSRRADRTVRLFLFWAFHADERCFELVGVADAEVIPVFVLFLEDALFGRVLHGDVAGA
jgi:hypothetical protein